MQPSSRHGVAFDPNVEMGLTDLEMANGLEYDEEFDPDRTFDMEYEVSSSIDHIHVINKLEISIDK